VAIEAAKLVLDTSAYSHFRRGDTRVADAIAAAATVFIPAIVLGELEAGFTLGNRTKDNRAVLSEFLNEVFISIVPVSTTVANHYGRLFAELRRAGTPVPTNDIWIGATVLDVGGQLLTFDSDFLYLRSVPSTVLDAAVL